eukprot:1670300-Rhodomonas_salina.1
MGFGTREYMLCSISHVWLWALASSRRRCDSYPSQNHRQRKGLTCTDAPRPNTPDMDARLCGRVLRPPEVELEGERALEELSGGVPRR